MISGEPVIPPEFLGRTFTQLPVRANNRWTVSDVEGLFSTCRQWTNRNVAATKLTISREGVLIRERV